MWTPQETVAAFPLPFKLRKLKLQIENTPNGNMSIGNIAKKLLCSHEVVFHANLKYISKLQWNQFLCIYTSHATACFRSGSPCCFAKDTRPRLLWLKIMASAVVVIYINLFDNSHYFFNSTCGANVTHFSFNNNNVKIMTLTKSFKPSSNQQFSSFSFLSSFQFPHSTGLQSPEAFSSALLLPMSLFLLTSLKPS